MKLTRVPPEVAERLGPFYVYALVDPSTNRIFYVGKGTGTRLLAHGREADLTVHDSNRSAKVREIRRIRASGTEPQIDVVRHGLSEADALVVEAALISTLPDLTNAVAGHRGGLGRAPLEEYAVEFGALPVPDDAPPALLIRINQWSEFREEIEPGTFRFGNGFRLDMTDRELVDSTRAWWRVSPKTVAKRGIKHAVAVHRGTTRGVMRIGEWIQRADGRWAFGATLLTEGVIFDAWVGELGRRLTFTPSAQNPVMYWPRPA